MREQKYPNGYGPKIEYYQVKLNEAIADSDIEAVSFYSRKLTYFMSRQEALVSARLAALVD